MKDHGGVYLQVFGLAQQVGILEIGFIAGEVELGGRAAAQQQCRGFQENFVAFYRVQAAQQADLDLAAGLRRGKGGQVYALAYHPHALAEARLPV